MPRYIADEYEIADDDDLPLEGKLRRRNPPRPFTALATIAALAVGAIVAYLGYHEIVARQDNDTACLSCHTDEHKAYFERGEAAVAGALAVDLSSFHYQQIRGQGGNIRCIDCHRGDDRTPARVETVALSGRISLLWLLRGEVTGTEATAKLRTDPSGIASAGSSGEMLGASALIAPKLSNDGCVNCHSETLLTAGLENHVHNALPVAYTLWKNGARLIPPAGDADAQAVISRGLVRYNTSVSCSDCHQTHRSVTESEQRFMNAVQTERSCARCHAEAGITVERK
jgi:nitrate/TMAO reductase-like tetraheme cytochrome c subunit